VLPVTTALTVLGPLLVATPLPVLGRLLVLRALAIVRPLPVMGAGIAGTSRAVATTVAVLACATAVVATPTVVGESGSGADATHHPGGDEGDEGDSQPPGDGPTLDLDVGRIAQRTERLRAQRSHHYSKAGVRSQSATESGGVYPTKL
jgi:hypothetical protein